VDYLFSDEAIAFGEEVRAWLEAELDPEWESKYEPTSPEWIAFQRDWDQRLYRRGWGAIYWPQEHGGLGATPEFRAMFSRQFAEAGAPDGLGKIGKRLLAPVLMRHGSPEQKERFLPPLLRGEEFWAQGYSEPGSGSDLASLSTRGRVEGDELVINGQKIWTSHGWYCEWIFALVRTSKEAKKQDGISFVLVKADTPGVEIRPISQINGKSEFAEVFFTDARVPVDQVVGPIGQGWTIAKALLEFERGAEMSLGRSGTIRSATRELVRDLGGADAIGDTAVAQALGLHEAQFLGADINTLRLLGAQMAGGDPGHISALVKLQQTEDWRAATVRDLELLGPRALQGSGSHFERYFSARPGTIASGSSEVQRNILAKRVLGLRD